MSFRTVLSTTAAVLLFVASPALAQAPEPGDEWRITMSMSAEGFNMPGRTSTQCIARAQRAYAPEPDDKNCRVLDVQTSGDTTTMRMVCTGDEPMEGTGTFTTTDKIMKGEMVMKMRRGTARMTYAGENTGKACDAKALERQANAMIAQGQAATEKYCTDSARAGTLASLFFGANATCADAKYKQMYCGNVKGERGYEMLANEAQIATSTRNPNPVPDIERACGISMAGMERELCTTAEQRKSWTFLAKSCPAQAQPLAAAQCAGRGYTAMAESPYRAFCSAYGIEPVSSDDAAAKPADAPAPAKPAEGGVRRGIRGLRGVLGR